MSERTLLSNWSERLCVALIAAVVIYSAVRFVSAARESGDQDRIRAKVRNGELAPEAGRGLVDDEEIERLRALHESIPSQ